MNVRPIEITKETEALIQQVVAKYIDTTPPLQDSLRLKNESNIDPAALARHYYSWNVVYQSGNGVDPNPTEMSAGFIESVIKVQLDTIRLVAAEQGYTFDRFTKIIFEYDEPTSEWHLDIYFTATKA